MWYHLSDLGHFCDTSEGTGELQKGSKKALAQKREGQEI